MKWSDIKWLEFHLYIITCMMTRVTMTTMTLIIEWGWWKRRCRFDEDDDEEKDDDDDDEDEGDERLSVQEKAKNEEGEEEEEERGKSVGNADVKEDWEEDVEEGKGRGRCSRVWRRVRERRAMLRSQTSGAHKGTEDEKVVTQTQPFSFLLYYRKLSPLADCAITLLR